MSARACARHPAAAAAHRCDGCGELLCAECVEEGHRLLFCRLCGERALPLDDDGRPAAAPRNIVERRRAAVARSAVGYGFAEALAYPFRGYGAYGFWGFVVLLVVLDLVERAFPLGLGGLATWVPRVLIVLLLPAFLFAIANSTARGQNELPDWPDFDFWSLVRSLFLFLLATAVSLLPLLALAWLADCGPLALLAGESSLGFCLLVAAVGALLAVALWIPAFGSTALYDTFGAFYRLDMHVPALLVAPAEAAATTALLALLLVLRAVLPALFSLVPLVGGILGAAVAAYTLFTGAHLVGVYFRRHWGELETLYLG